MLLSVIIPVYNEAGTVGQVIEKVRSVSLGAGIDKEIIVVNDGSSDGTRESLGAWEKVEGVRVHHSPVNLGKGSSVRIGFSFAKGDLVIIQDADLELDPNDYHRLIAPIIEGRADVVFGSRFLGDNPRGKLTFYVANRSLAVITNALFGASLSDIETCYKVFRRDVLPTLKLRASRFEIEPEITSQVLKRGHRLLEVPISYSPRTHAEGKKLNWRDGFAAISMLVRQRLED